MSLIGKTPKLTSLPEMAWWSIQRDVSIYTALSLTDYMNLQSGLERSQPQPRFSPLHTIQNIDADPWKAGGKGRGLAQLARVYHHPWLRHIEIVRQQNQNHAKQTGSTSWQGGVYATVSWSIQGLFREVLFFPSQSLNLPSSQPRLPVIGANFRARFTDTVLGNQACSAQTKSKEIAWVIGASSCRATVSSKQGCGEWQWSVTREQCDRSHFMRLPSKRKKKTVQKKKIKKNPLFCWATGTKLLERPSWPAPATSKLDHCVYKIQQAQFQCTKTLKAQVSIVLVSVLPSKSYTASCSAEEDKQRVCKQTKNGVRLSFTLPFRCAIIIQSEKLELD